MRQVHHSQPAAHTGPPAAPSTYPMLPPVQATIFRPRGTTAIGVILIPAICLLGVIAVTRMLHLRGDSLYITLGVAIGIVGGWLLLILTFARILLMTVCSTSEQISIRTPWGRTRTLQWSLIEYADWRWGFLRLQSSDGQRVVILANGLSNGEQLIRHAVLRVSPNVLSAPLQRELDFLNGTASVAVAIPEIPIAAAWMIAAGILAVGGAGLAAWASITRLTPVMAIGVITGFIGVIGLLLFRQTLSMTPNEITIQRTGGIITLKWSDVILIERTQLGLVLALRTAQRRVRFLGPFFMSPHRRSFLMHVFAERQRIQGTTTFNRWWI
jgi:hypothetical protein